MKERIQKILANAGVASRRAVEEMVLQGRIAVNGQIASELPILINPQSDKVEVDGEHIRLRLSKNARKLYFLLNKPKGVICTNVAQGAQLRAVDLLPKDLPGRVYPVGTLDADSKGLLLLTNDGDLTNRLTHLKFGVDKVYRVAVEGHVEAATIKQLAAGVWLADPKKGKGFKTGACRIKIVRHVREQTIMELTMRETRNRQIWRMFVKFGHKVRDLTRIRMGPLTIEGVSIGKYRELLPVEVKQLQQWARRDSAMAEK